jgi:hypothetical protein
MRLKGIRGRNSRGCFEQDVDHIHQEQMNKLRNKTREMKK